MRNIIHILSAIDGGGAERVVLNYYKHIDRNKFHFDLAVIDKGHKQLLEDEFRALGADIHYVPKPIMPRLRAINKLMKENQYDTVHCHRIFGAEIYMILGWHNHIKQRIAHAHMAYVVGHKKGVFLNWLLKPLLKMFTTDRLACGKEAGKYVWGSLKNVTILNNAIDLKAFHPNQAIRNKYRKLVGVDTNDIVIGHVGRFNEQKNHEFLLQVFNQTCSLYPNYKFQLVLIGNGENLEYIKSKAIKSKYKDQIHFMGLRNDVNDFMQSFDVFCLPSLFEGLPVVGVEAQASGLPCVFSDSITQEFNMGKRVKFLSLNDSLEVWSKWLFNFGSPHTKDDNTKIISEKGYNISIEGKKLEKIYMRKR